MAMLACFTAALLGAKVFIQGDTINLRASADAKAAVVEKVEIGTECEQKSQKGDWVELQCGEVTGFTKAALVGPEKPSLEALMAQSNDASLLPKDRYNAASRAAHLKPDDEALLDRLVATFFDATRDEVYRGKSRVDAVKWYPAAGSRSDADILVESLECTTFGWHTFDPPTGNKGFVSAMERDGQLQVVYGVGALNERPGGFKKGLVYIYAKSLGPGPELLMRALERKARKTGFVFCPITPVPQPPPEVAAKLKGFEDAQCSKTASGRTYISGDFYGRFAFVTSTDQDTQFFPITSATLVGKNAVDINGDTRCKR